MPSQFCLKDAKYCLLTYAQVPEDIIERLPLDIVRKLGSDDIRAECTVARERHADGGWHLHVFVDFGRKYSVRSTRVFDLCGQHPNIERVGRTPWVAYDYAIKEGDIVAGIGERPVQHESSGRSTARDGSDWSIIVQSETRDEFFRLLHELQPRSLVCSYTSIAKYADWKFKPVPECYRHPENISFNLENYPVLLDWVDDNLNGGVMSDR